MGAQKTTELPWTVTVFVPGLPRPKGSTKAMRHSKTGKIITLPASKYLREWERTVCVRVKQFWMRPTWKGPVWLEIEFLMPKPKKSVNTYPISRPDLDKCLRAIGDALTGTVFDDDSQVVGVLARKNYAPKGELIGARIVINCAMLTEPSWCRLAEAW